MSTSSEGMLPAFYWKKLPVLASSLGWLCSRGARVRFDTPPALLAPAGGHPPPITLEIRVPPLEWPTGIHQDLARALGDRTLLRGVSQMLPGTHLHLAPARTAPVRD